MLNWKPGRQEGSKYFILTIFSSLLLKMDCYLIKYPPFGFIKPHLDTVPAGRKHYRLNIDLFQVRGLFACKGPYWHFWIFTLFRPDLYMHSYFSYSTKNRIVLSFGFSIKDRNHEQKNK